MRARGGRGGRVCVQQVTPVRSTPDPELGTARVCPGSMWECNISRVGEDTEKGLWAWGALGSCPWRAAMGTWAKEAA